MDYFDVTVRNQKNFVLSATKGAALWSDKTFSPKPHKCLKNINNEDLSPNLLHSFGIEVKIPNFEENINRIIIPKGTYVPLESPIDLRLKVKGEDLKLNFLEGEGIMPLENN